MCRADFKRLLIQVFRMLCSRGAVSGRSRALAVLKEVLMKTAELLETASGAAAATILPRGGIQSKYKVSNLAGVIRARYLLLGANTP